MNKSVKKKSLLSGLLITILTLLFLPWFSQAQVFPSDAVTYSATVHLQSSNSYSITIASNKSILFASLLFEYTSAGTEIFLSCSNPNQTITKIYNSATTPNFTADFLNLYCVGDIKVQSASNDVYATYSLTVIPRDIANTDDPRLMPVQMTDFYDTLNQILKFGFFWVQILAIAWFFLVVVLYRFIWRWLGAYKFFQF